MPHLYFTFSSEPRVLMKWCVSSDPPLPTAFIYIIPTTGRIALPLLPSEQLAPGNLGSTFQENWVPGLGMFCGQVREPAADGDFGPPQGISPTLSAYWANAFLPHLRENLC